MSHLVTHTKIFTFTSFPPHSTIIICRVIPIARRLRKQDHRTTRFIMVLERRCSVPFVRLRTTGSSDTTTPNTTNATTTPIRSGVTTVMDQRIIDLGRSECNPPFADNSIKTSRFTLLSFFPLVRCFIYYRQRPGGLKRSIMVPVIVVALQ